MTICDHPFAAARLSKITPRPLIERRSAFGKKYVTPLKTQKAPPQEGYQKPRRTKMLKLSTKLALAALISISAVSTAGATQSFFLEQADALVAQSLGYAILSAPSIFSEQPRA